MKTIFYRHCLLAAIALISSFLGEIILARRDLWSERYQILSVRTAVVSETLRSLALYRTEDIAGGDNTAAAIVYGSPALVGEFPGYAVAS